MNKDITTKCPLKSRRSNKKIQNAVFEVFFNSIEEKYSPLLDLHCIFPYLYPQTRIYLSFFNWMLF